MFIEISISIYVYFILLVCVYMFIPIMVLENLVKEMDSFMNIYDGCIKIVVSIVFVEGKCLKGISKTRRTYGILEGSKSVLEEGTKYP